MSEVDIKYAALVKEILSKGERRSDRTGVGTRSLFGRVIELDLRESFPVVALKETRWKTAFLEMLWFLRGESNTSFLHEHGSKLWDPWADDDGHLGPVYGCTWRDWGGIGIDQVRGVIEGVRNNPAGRRHIVSAWNVTELDNMKLPPCHWAHQLYAVDHGGLDMMLHIRSSDVGLGLPFNIAQYAMLLTLYARATDRWPRRLVVTLGDVHIYDNHLESMAEVAERSVDAGNQPQLIVSTENTDIDGYKPGDFVVANYRPRSFVPLPVAV